MVDKIPSILYPRLMTNLSLIQRQVIESPLDIRLFVSGSAGTGKTTTGIERLRYLLDQGVPADSILMLTPQRTMQEPYQDLLFSPERRAGGEVTSATIGGLARRICDLFWPMAAEAAGFRNPDQPPVFLTLETAQYYMAYLVRPLLEQGYFQSLTIDRNRLYSQILDNLNKAAVVGFPYTEIGSRMDDAWFGDPGQRRIYQDAQECASLFREYCLENNLLDFSLQLDIFANILWPQEQVQNFLKQTYRHLIYDNVEEDAPRAHDIIGEWLADFDSALLIYDNDAGYRYFLGGDAVTGYALSEACDERIEFAESFVASENIIQLSNTLVSAIAHQEPENANPSNALEFILAHYYPEMLDEIVAKIKLLVEQDGIPPSEIVVLAPYLSDALRFSITHRLDQAGIPSRTHRPSRSLRDEAGSQSLLVLSALAHPHWKVHPTKFDVTHAFMFALNTDLIRAQLLTEIVYRQKDLRLSTFDEIKPEMQERITYLLGEKYTNLCNWLNDYREQTPLPLDFFLRKLFGEVLSQPDHGFHHNADAIRIASSLIESIKKFRYAMESSNVNPEFDLGREYLAMLEDGVIAAQYLESWRSENKDSVLVAPAHTFLLMNHPVTVQFWLDPGSSGWVQRLSQPLTHPYVLSRHWESGRLWMDTDEVNAEIEALARLAGGLLSRCRERLFLALADLSETGFEQRGTLLKAFQKVIQQESQ
ncbi:MAG TPA: UvrD-helicase domain-containing protein [Anaerolineales bacterium]|nr:UvrD-helicase domain-containing protein [Anaerolineales bacterium]